MKKHTVLRKFQFNNGITNRDISDDSGLHEATVSLIATGRLKPSAKQKKLIASALGKDILFLFPDN